MAIQVRFAPLSENSIQLQMSRVQHIGHVTPPIVSSGASRQSAAPAMYGAAAFAAMCAVSGIVGSDGKNDRQRLPPSRARRKPKKSV